MELVRLIGTLLYLVEPNATTFQHVEEVPDYINEAVPVLMTLCFLELGVRWLVGREHRFDEAFANLGYGLLHETTRMMVTGTVFLGYEWLYQYRLLDLPWDSLYTWLAAFVLVDFCYYLIHRANHELNILWAVHQVHHGGEDFNWTTGLRLSVFQKLAHFGFYQPMALLGIPLPAVLVHTGLNFVYQFWVHSTFIGNLGPLEWVFITPSHHRVHHGANNWCLDKNYGGVFILWDRLFGTFELERKDSEIVFGLTHQPQTHSALYHQFFCFGEIIRKARSMSTWTDSLKAVFYGPGWAPGTPRLGDPATFPVITAPRTKYDPQVPSWKLLYIILNLIVTLLIQQQLLTRYPTASWMTVLAFLGFITSSVGVLTSLLDGWEWARPIEVARCALYLLCARSLFATHVPVLDTALNIYFSLCIVFWTCHSLVHLLVGGKTQKTQ